MSLTDLPRSPQSGACADLDLFCSHAAYCIFFTCLRVLVGCELEVGERGGDNSEFSNQTNAPL